MSGKLSTEMKQSSVREPSKKARERLRKIESKYFGESDDELASDLSGADSEFEQDEADDDGSSDEDASMGSSDEAPDEVGTVSKCSKKRQMEKQKGRAAESRSKKPKSNELDHESESSDIGSSESDEESEEEDLENDGLDDLLNGSDSGEESNDDIDDNDDGDADSGDDDFDSDDDKADSGDEHDDAGSDGKTKQKVWEDIYGRTRDQDGNVVNEIGSSNGETKYVPPHLRARLAAAAVTGDGASNDAEMDPKRREKLLRLKKLLKGNLNRLSEANMHKIATDIDNLYMQNSRHDMNNTIATLIVDALITNVLAPERMVMEHMMLVAALHANVGTEVGAHILEVLIDRFHGMLKSGIEQYEVEDKTLDNIVLILCHMYTFRVSASI